MAKVMPRNLTSITVQNPVTTLVVRIGQIQIDPALHSLISHRMDVNKCYFFYHALYRREAQYNGEIRLSGHYGWKAMAGNTESVSTGRIVAIALDGSDHSNYAFEWYRDNIYKADDYVVIIHCPEYQHCLHTGHARPDIKQLVNQIEEEQKKKTQLMENFSTMLTDAGINGKIKSVMGHAGEVILRVALDEKATFIITGTRGCGKVRRTLLGSVSDYVIHHSHIPVVICRQ